MKRKSYQSLLPELDEVVRRRGEKGEEKKGEPLKYRKPKLLL
jgi:hypothetical protein